MTILVHPFDNAQVHHDRLFILFMKADLNYQQIVRAMKYSNFINNHGKF